MAARQEVTLVIRARDQTRAVFNRLRRSIGRFRVGLAGLFSGLAFGALARDAVNTATAIEGAAARLGESGDELEALRQIAGDLNINFESLSTVIQRLGTNASRAVDGNQELLNAFRELGIASSPRELRGLSNLEIFFRIADAAQVRNWRDISASIARIGDTEAVRLRGLLEQGGTGLQRQIDQLIESGQILGEENRRTAAAAEAQFRRDVAESQRALADALIAFTPVLQRAIPLLTVAIESGEAIIRRGEETGGFGLGETAFDIASSRRAQALGASAMLGPVGIAAQINAALIQELTTKIGQIEINTREGGRLQ